MSDLTDFAERVLRLADERDAALYAALRCWCGGSLWCPRTWRLRHAVAQRESTTDRFGTRRLCGLFALAAIGDACWTAEVWSWSRLLVMHALVARLDLAYVRLSRATACEYATHEVRRGPPRR